MHIISSWLLAAAIAFQPQTPVRVTLNQRTTLDEEEAHVTPFHPTAKEKLLLPSSDQSSANFFGLYCRIADNDREIAAMMIVRSSYDELHVDLNNDEDLTNDGAPLRFPHAQNELVITLPAPHDQEQRVQLLLQRRPVFVDMAHTRGFHKMLFDGAGNLNKGIAMMTSSYAPGFAGKKGSFYFDNRIALSRGEALLDGKKYSLALFDYDVNGRFNDHEGKDTDDLLLVDLNGDGRLEFVNEHEVFKLNEVIPIGGKNYCLTGIDPYGRFVDLQMTNAEPGFAYLKQINEARKTLAPMMATAEIDSSFWSLRLQNLAGEALPLSKFKGQYLLLNFWGEWCKPCVHEIPELAAAYQKLPREKFEIISFLETNNLAAAQRMIVEKNMSWQHVRLSKELKEKFKIRGYPTNILISPEGKARRSMHQINQALIYQHVQ